MKSLISKNIREAAKNLLEVPSEPTPGLSDQQQRTLRDKGKKVLQTVKDNLSKKRDGFEGLSFEDKKLLLAYTIYYRQNLGVPVESPEEVKNDEDAALILYGDIYKITDGKKSQDRLDKDLSKQLKKGLGIVIESQK